MHQTPNRTSVSARGFDPDDAAAERIDGDIVVHGSATLVQGLIEHDIVDELRLMVYPVLLGTGRRMFCATAETKPLRLVDVKPVGGGVVVLVDAL
jgi:dihydrofolate reductase